VIDRTDSSTLIEAVCCGRFTSDEGLLYRQSGPPPFHVLGPPLPAGWKPVDRGVRRFSVHERAECWDRADLEHLRDVERSVRVLRLLTDEFDVAWLAELPDLDSMVTFEHRRCSMNDDPIAPTARFGELRTLRIYFTRTARPKLPVSAPAIHVETLALTNLPPEPWGFGNVARSVPGARRVDLASAETLWLDGEFGPLVKSVSVTARRLQGRARLPRDLDSLSVHLDDHDEEAVVALLDGVRRIRAIHLRRTTLSDDFISSLPSRFRPEFMDIVETGVSRDTVERIGRDFPDLRLLPNLGVGGTPRLSRS
jgi:hypothetical protein